MGTSLPKDEARAFKVAAAQRGLSIAAFLRELALAAVAEVAAPKPTKRRRAQTNVNHA